MAARKIISALFFLFAFSLVMFPSVDALWRKTNQISVSARNADLDDGDIPHVHYLVQLIGKEFYSALNSPTYKFFIYMTVGSLPSEKDAIVLVSTLCNVLYCISILIGFIFFRRGPMLAFSIATLWIGPALVLMILGFLGLMVVGFALYPIISVSLMISCFFLTSQLGQTLGVRFGLDSDQDGDVDWLDLIHAMAKTELGKSMGLLKVYEFFHQATQDPFKEIHRRLDSIHENTTEMNNSTRDLYIQRSNEYEEGDSELRNSAKKGL